MKRLFAAMMAVVLLILCGCQSIIPQNGTLDLNANEIDHIRINNSSTGKAFTVSDRETIGTIISHLNSFTLENGTNTESGDFSYCYRITLVHKSSGSESEYYFADAQTILIDEAAYIVNAVDFLQYVEAQECKTLTDNELIDYLLEGNTLDQLNIIDDEGKISIDKIIALPQSCPALFELLSRPSAISSVGSYGVDKIGSFLNSANPVMVEKAQEWIEVLKKLLPEVQEKLDNLINNSENS